MGLLKEAGSVYVYSRDLIKLNKKLKRLSKHAKKHKRRHEHAPHHKKEKHYVRHSSTVNDIRDLMKKHDRVLMRLRSHYRNFAHYLKKEHKL